MASPGGTTLYDGFVALLLRYLSPASVHGTLETVAQKMRLDLQTLSSRDLERLVAEAMLGLRLFCDPERLPDLMLDLADFCEKAARTEAKADATPGSEEGS